jgi:hypothetical protein
MEDLLSGIRREMYERHLCHDLWLTLSVLLSGRCRQ